MHAEQAVKTCKKSSQTLEREITCINLCLHNPSGDNTVAAVETELHNLETCLSWVQQYFIKLDDNFPKEEETYDYNDPVESDREAKYVRPETSYFYLRRELFIANMTLEAAAEIPVEMTAA